jgi:hypothetical protein
MFIYGEQFYPCGVYAEITHELHGAGFEILAPVIMKRIILRM